MMRKTLMLEHMPDPCNDVGEVELSAFSAW